MTVLVGRQAPDFTVASVLGSGEIVDQFNFYEATNNQYSVLFFYPLDFTFVCPSELIALDKAFDSFAKRNVQLVAVSIDSQFTHNAWRQTPISQGGIGPVRYTMAADINHSVCRSYGVEHPEAGVALRGVFVMDKNRVVRSQMVNDLPIGRSISEILRVVDALQFVEKHGEVCPANWQQGEKAMKPTPQGVADFLSEHCEQL